MLDIELVETEPTLHLKSFKNGNIELNKLINFVHRQFTLNKIDPEQREEFNTLIDDATKRTYEAGYYRGLRENKGKEEIKSANDWKPEQVYPKGSLRD